MSSSCYNGALNTMTLGCESTKLTAYSLAEKRRRVMPSNTSTSVLRGTGTEDHMSQPMANSALGQPDETQLVGPSSVDETMIHALKNPSQTPLIIGVSTRKLKSLKFRLRRRELKIVQSGTPFNKRDCLKNTNRQTAAL